MLIPTLAACFSIKRGKKKTFDTAITRWSHIEVIHSAHNNKLNMKEIESVMTYESLPRPACVMARITQHSKQSSIAHQKLADFGYRGTIKQTRI